MCYSCEREYIKTIHKCKKNGKEIVEINEYIDRLERRKVSHIHCQRIGHWLRPKIFLERLGEVTPSQH